MPTKAAIDEFLSHKTLALVRQSRSIPVRGVGIDAQLGANGYAISIVYLDDPEPGQQLNALKKTVEGVIIATPMNQAELAAKAVLEAGMPRVWFQQGCETREAVAQCETAGVPVVHGACVLMYAEPVKSFHSFHRWVWKTFGLLAK